MGAVEKCEGKSLEPGSGVLNLLLQLPAAHPGGACACSHTSSPRTTKPSLVAFTYLCETAARPCWEIPWTDPLDWWATVHRVAKSQTQLSDHTITTDVRGISCPTVGSNAHTGLSRAPVGWDVLGLAHLACHRSLSLSSLQRLGRRKYQPQRLLEGFVTNRQNLVKRFALCPALMQAFTECRLLLAETLLDRILICSASISLS